MIAPAYCTMSLVCALPAVSGGRMLLFYHRGFRGFCEARCEGREREKARAFNALRADCEGCEGFRAYMTLAGREARSEDRGELFYTLGARKPSQPSRSLALALDPSGFLANSTLAKTLAQPSQPSLIPLSEAFRLPDEWLLSFSWRCFLSLQFDEFAMWAERRCVSCLRLCAEAVRGLWTKPDSGMSPISPTLPGISRKCSAVM